MKNKTSITLHLFILFSYFTSNGLNIALNIEKPKVKDVIKIEYKGYLSEKSTKLYCVTYFKDFSKITRTLEIKSNKEKILSTYTVPDSAVYFIFYAVNKSEIDNNHGKGYGFHVYENNKPTKYSYLMKGYYNKINEFLFKGNTDYYEAAKNIEKEWQLYPEMKNICMPYYFEISLKIPERKNETMVLIKNQVDNSINNKIEEEKIRYFANLYYKNNRIGLDSVKNILINIFPNGITLSEKKINKIKYGENSNTIFEKIDSLLNGENDLTISQKKDLLLFKLAVLLYQNKLEKFETVLANAQNEYSNLLLYSFLGNNFNEYAYSYFKGNNLEMANRFSKQSLRFYGNVDSLSIQYGNCLDTYASIIYGSGDINNAIKYQNKAVELTNLQSEDSNQRLIEYLNKAKNFSEIINMGNEIIRANTSTNLIDSLYENALKVLNKEDSDYINRKKEAFHKHEKEILSKIINNKAQDFALFDLNGKIVRLKDYEGQILIIDFWATWCKPCLASFPAMKKLQREFKEKNVKFLFISTLEHESRSDSINLTKKIKELTIRKDFTEFEILQDQINPKTGNFITSIAYNVEGIPAKFIVDQTGNLRYRSVGFGSEDKLRIELETVVRFLLNE